MKAETAFQLQRHPLPRLSLAEVIKDSLVSHQAHLYSDFTESVLHELKGRPCALLMYGSCLSSVTKSPDSSPDYFVVVRSYEDFYGQSKTLRQLNQVLAPNIFHFKVGSARSKYSVVSLDDLQTATSFEAKDMYHLGRFSKRMAWLESSDSEIRLETLCDVQMQAMNVVAEKTIPLMESEFDLDAFCLKAISLSYLGDFRVEAGDKSTKIYEASKEYFRNCYESILSTMVPYVLESRPQGYKLVSQYPVFVQQKRVSDFLRRSQMRAKLRWPKAMFTAEDWLDYILDKIERTQGIKITLTPMQKKLWFIYGWKYFLQLKREKRIK